MKTSTDTLWNGFPTPTVPMTISLQSGNLVIEWTADAAVLQESEDLALPAAWADIPTAASLYTDPRNDGAQRPSGGRTGKALT